MKNYSHKAIHSCHTVYNMFEERYIQTEEAKVVKLVREVEDSGEGTIGELASTSLLIHCIILKDEFTKDKSQIINVFRGFFFRKRVVSSMFVNNRYLDFPRNVTIYDIIK